MALNDVKEIAIPVINITNYTKLDYIQGTGTQYINTNFYVKPTTCVEIDYQFTSTEVQQGLFGVGGDFSYQCYINGAGSISYCYNNNSGNWVNTGIVADLNRHKIAVDGKKVYFRYDDTGITALQGTATNTANVPLTIFWRNNQSSAGSGVCKAKLFGCKIWDNGVLVRNYIPVKNNNNIAGLYDTVNNTFTSSAVDNFVAGNILTTNNVDKIVDSNNNIIWGSQTAFPYRRLEYIHFSGAERIDTKMKPQVHFYYLNCKVQKRTDTWTIIWGAAHTINNAYFRLFWQSDTTGTLHPRLKDTDTDTVSGTENKIVQLRLRNYNTNNTTGTYWWACQDLNGNGLSDGDGATEMMGKYYNSSTYACNFNNFNTTIAIGQYHRDGSWVSAGAQPIMDVYRYFIRNTHGSSAIVNDQYPCQRKSDGVCGLYDVKTNIFYPMEGTNITTNAAGPIADEYWDLTAPS